MFTISVDVVRAGVTLAVVIGVGLFGVSRVDAVVARVTNAIPVRILLIRVVHVVAVILRAKATGQFDLLQIGELLSKLYSPGC